MAETHFYMEDSGRTIKLKKGESFNVTLNGNPTTGYEWGIINSDDNVFILSGMDYKVDSNAMGSGGRYTWVFKAVGNGSSVLKMVYCRSWEKDKPPIRTFELSIEVE